MPKPEVSSGSKANVLNQRKSTEQQPIARKLVACHDSWTEKASHRLHLSVNSFFMKLKEKVHTKDEEMHQLQARTQRKRKKQRSNSYGEISISKQLPCLPSTVNLVAAQKKNKELSSKTKSSKSQSRPSTAGDRATSATENTVRCSRAEIYNRCSTNE
ncbi:hypothetical protein P3S67_029372 [Capsicum chacoense]